MQRSRRVSAAAAALDLWPVLLAVVLCWPLLTASGHPLARDFVFAPHQPWTDATLGLGDAAPRAVPLDALVSLASVGVDGGVLAKVVLPLVLALAGWGVHRALGSLGTVARLAAAGFAVWNPFVVERLALGQWALLAGYAALPWLAMAATRWRRDGRLVDLAAVACWLAVASITPTGGLIGTVTVLVLGAETVRRTLPLAGIAAVLQLPWVLPGLVGSTGLTSDPDGVAAFAARAEGPGGVIASVLGLGGIWDGLSVPGSRETWWGTAAAVVAVVVVVVGVPRLARTWGRGVTGRAAGLGVGGLLLALLSSWGPGADLVRWVVETVPGGGLLRDSQKYAAGWAVLVACCVGVVTDVAVAATRRAGPELGVPLVVTVLLTPFLLLPDATRVTWPTVTPVDWPAGVTGLDALLDELADDEGAEAPVATLPWRSYRLFEWGTGLTSSDPALRLLDRPVLVADELVVGELVVSGESSLAASLGRALETSSPAEALAATGIPWVVVYRDDPDADELDLSGLELRAETPEVAVYRAPAVADRHVAAAGPARWTVIAGTLLAALLVLLAAVTRVALRKQAAHRFW